MLLPGRVERRERVLPAPDDEHPDEHGDAGRQHQRPGDPRDPLSVHPSSAFRSLADGCLRAALTVSTVAADRLPQWPARRPLARARVGRVAADRQRRHLSRCGEPADRDRQRGQSDVAGRRQFGQIPGRVEPEAVAQRERGRGAAAARGSRRRARPTASRSGAAGRAAARATRAARAAGRSARTDSSPRRAARRPPGRAARRSRRRAPRSPRPARAAPGGAARPASRAPRGTRAPGRRSPASSSPGEASGGSGTAGADGQMPISANSSNRIATQSQKPTRLR